MVALAGCIACLAIVSPSRSQGPPSMGLAAPAVDTDSTAEATENSLNSSNPSNAVNHENNEKAENQENTNHSNAENYENNENQSNTSDVTKVSSGRKLGRGDVERLGTKGDSSFGNLPMQLLASLLVVLVLGGVAIVVLRRLLPRLKWGRLVGQGRKIRLVESVSIGPRQRVHLLEVRGRSLLIAASRDGVRMLADVTDGFHEDEDEGGGEVSGGGEGPPPPSPGGFVGVLNKKLGGDA